MEKTVLASGVVWIGVWRKKFWLLVLCRLVYGEKSFGLWRRVDWCMEKSCGLCRRVDWCMEKNVLGSGVV